SSALDDDGIRQRAREALAASGKEIDPQVFDRRASHLCYVSGDSRDPELYPRIAARLAERTLPVAYLAIPPDTFGDVVAGLMSVGFHERGRLVVEKPFGRDTATAAELNELIHRGFPENRVYRIDHFLGKEAVQNLMVFRFSTPSSSPSGTVTTWRRCRSPSPRSTGSRGGAASTTTWAPSATWCRTISCRWLRCSPWSHRSPTTPTPCATSGPRCCAPCGWWIPATSFVA